MDELRKRVAEALRFLGYAEERYDSSGTDPAADRTYGDILCAISQLRGPLRDPESSRSAQAAWGSKLLRSQGFCGYVSIRGDPPIETGCILQPGHDGGVHVENPPKCEHLDTKWVDEKDNPGVEARFCKTCGQRFEMRAKPDVQEALRHAYELDAKLASKRETRQHEVDRGRYRVVRSEDGIRLYLFAPDTSIHSLLLARDPEDGNSEEEVIVTINDTDYVSWSIDTFENLLIALEKAERT